MLRHILMTALIAGALAGLTISVVQEFTTTPIILHAEEFENVSTAAASAAAEPKAVAAEENSEWGPEDSIKRTLFTSLVNVLTGVGFALLLVACFAFQGKEMTGRQGVLWGLAGYAVFSLGPALGLPPEVPGSMAAELAARQGWWLAAAMATALGLGLMVFGRGVAWIVAGAVIIAAPHIYGAPASARIGGAVPPELAGHFVAASLVTAAVFWSVLGWLSGTFYRRLA